MERRKKQKNKNEEESNGEGFVITWVAGGVVASSLECSKLPRIVKLTSASFMTPSTLSSGITTSVFYKRQ